MELRRLPQKYSGFQIFKESANNFPVRLQIQLEITYESLLRVECIFTLLYSLGKMKSSHYRGFNSKIALK